MYTDLARMFPDFNFVLDYFVCKAKKVRAKQLVRAMKSQPAVHSSCRQACTLPSMVPYKQFAWQAAAVGSDCTITVLHNASMHGQLWHGVWNVTNVRPAGCAARAEHVRFCCDAIRQINDACDTHRSGRALLFARVPNCNPEIAPKIVFFAVIDITVPEPCRNNCQVIIKLRQRTAACSWHSTRPIACAAIHAYRCLWYTIQDTCSTPLIRLGQYGPIQ